MFIYYKVCCHISTNILYIIPLSVIGLFSFFFSVVGNFLGVKFGVLVKKRLNPELLGGIILIIIGIKVLFTHLLS